MNRIRKRTGCLVVLGILALGVLGVAFRSPLTQFSVQYLRPPLDCKVFTNDPALTEDIFHYTGPMFDDWITQTYTDNIQLTSRLGGQSLDWRINGYEYRALFDDIDNPLSAIQRYHWDNSPVGLDIIRCFGDPAYYVGYYAPEPHGTAVVVDLFYPDRGLIFSSYQGYGWFLSSSPDAPDVGSPIRSLYRFPPVTASQQIAAYMGHPWYLDDRWDNQTLATSALKPWEGWGHVVVAEPDDLFETAPQLSATHTVVASTLSATPPFPLAEAATSESCQKVLDPVLYNLLYDEGTLAQTRLRIQTAYLTFYQQENTSLEPGGSLDGPHETIRWQPLEEQTHVPASYEAHFENDILEYVQATRYSSALRLGDLITCLGTPTEAIVFEGETSEGLLRSIYLFFTEQGIVTATYLYDDEIGEMSDALPVMMLFQAAPNQDGVALLDKTFDISTPAWRAALQTWQGWDALEVQPHPANAE